MGKAEVLLDSKLDVSERFRVELRVFLVTPSPKHPDGIRTRFVLIDVERKAPRLLVDNHAPFGFHAHEKLPEHKGCRRTLNAADYLSALDEFWQLVRGILENED